MGIPLESTKGTNGHSSEEPMLPATKAQKSHKSNRSASGQRGQHRNSGRLGTDAIGFYLSSIGRVPLLTPAEEIELAHHVQTMKKLLELPVDERTSRQRHQIRMGKRARDRMMAANLRLVVSVAKKISKPRTRTT